MPYNDCRTNCVDILSDNDQFHRGRVVDVADSGLFIDVCSNRRRELIPFNRIFQNVKPLMEKDLAEAYAHARPNMTIPVDVLVPETPGGPLAWFPAEIVNMMRGLRHKTCSTVVVQWVQNDVPCTDLVRLNRLRWRLASDWWATISRKGPVLRSVSENWHDGICELGKMSTWLQPVGPGAFEKRSVSLPIDCCHVDVDKLMQNLKGKACRSATVENDDRPVYFVDIKDGRVSYLWRHLPKGILQEIICFIDFAQYQAGRCHDGLIARIRQISGLLPQQRASLVEREESDNLLVLSTAVLLEVFSQLDTHTQTGLHT
ncbi:uncharacterized protein LOC129595795 [Paramacrobiotus metropolitanus]|uniref:uncharacterized protein LOC129595795 n=1 Tax=Paramacrobiotus metropolitanus TaxID=2943436 RepID=UPI002445F44B|nr:uncharacterized protein LOC129595795 [Paramacrobiotus metropolitanus]